MSRTDFVVDGETVAQAHQFNADDVRLSFDGGDTFPLRLDRFEHVVVEVTTEAADDE